MSHAKMITIPKVGPYEAAAEYRNAWGGMARIWTALSDKYGIPWLCSDGHEFWDLVEDPRLTDTERIVFASTFDRAVWEREHAQDLARLFREFSRTFPSKGVDHLPAWADFLEQHAGDDCIGFGMIGTSVSDDVWMLPTGNEAEDEPTLRPFAWDRDKDADQHFMLFAKYGRAA